MKKLTLLLTTMLAFVAYSTHAQEQRVWTFDLTSADVTNLDADANWAKNGTDAEGNTTYWFNANNDVFGSDELLANDYKLFPGLKITMGTATQTNNSVIVYRNGRMRLTRNDMRIIIPQVYNGQTITITAKSANATATNRGIEPVSSNVQLISGQTTDGQCIFLGMNVEGSIDNYTFVWKVETMSEEPEDVEFRILGGGIDFKTIAVNTADNERAFPYDNVEYWTSLDAEGEAVAVSVRQVYDDNKGWYRPDVITVHEQVVNPFDGKTYRVTSMSAGAFNFEGIEVLTLPNSITEIPANAFKNNQWLRFILMPNALTSIGDAAFQSCTALESIDIYSVADDLEVGGYTFRYCTNLKSATIENAHIKSIPIRMFCDCPNLSYVRLPNSCQTIGAAAFGNTALTSVLIPSQVSKIENWAFDGCPSLKSIISLNPKPAKIEGLSFGNDDQIAGTTLFVPDGSTAAYQAASNWNRISTVRELVNIDTPDQFVALSGKGFYYLQNVATGQYLTFDGNRAVLGDNGTEFRAGGPMYYFGCGMYQFDFNIVYSDDFQGYNCNRLSVSEYDGGAYSDQYNHVNWLLVKGDQEGTVRLHYDITDPVLGPERGYLTVDMNPSPYQVNANGNEDSYSLWRFVTKDELAKQQANGLYAENVTARPGKTVDLPIMLNNTQNIQGMQFDIQLPEGVSIVKNGRSWPVTINDNFAWGFNVSAEDKGNGHYRFVLSSQEAITDRNGKVADITLTLSEGMALGDYEITLTDIELTTEQNEAIKPQSAYSTLTVKSYEPGDVNDSGEVSVTDVTMVINYILGKNPANFNFEAADVIRDGIINVSDVSAIINIILGK